MPPTVRAAIVSFILKVKAEVALMNVDTLIRLLEEKRAKSPLDGETRVYVLGVGYREILEVVTEASPYRDNVILLRCR